MTVAGIAAFWLFGRKRELGTDTERHEPRKPETKSFKIEHYEFPSILGKYGVHKACNIGPEFVLTSELAIRTFDSTSVVRRNR